MDLWPRTIAVALLTSSAMMGISTSPAAADHLHPGRVIDRGSNAPVSADVKAWSSARQTGETSDCPEFGESPIDARTSEASTGDFALKVPVNVRTYTVVYCANGYHRKVDRHLPNSDDGTPVIPMPARLRKESDIATHEANSSAMSSEAIQVVIFTLNELAYLYEINPEEFQRSIEEYGKTVSEQDSPAAEVLFSISGLLASWTTRQTN